MIANRGGKRTNAAKLRGQGLYDEAAVTTGFMRELK